MIHQREVGRLVVVERAVKRYLIPANRRDENGKQQQVKKKQSGILSSQKPWNKTWGSRDCRQTDTTAKETTSDRRPTTTAMNGYI